MAIQTDHQDTSRSLGATTLLRDTLIRGGEDGDGARGKRESTKTAVLMALSRPTRPISRSQSQVTVAGELASSGFTWIKCTMNNYNLIISIHVAFEGCLQI